MTPYLYANPNRHAPVRANGIRFHGYPTRTKPVRLIVIHTAENTPDYIGEDGGAEAVARYQATVERPSSYHEIGDSDSHVTMLPPEAVAFGAAGANADGWHYSFATRAALWPTKPDRWKDGALTIGASRCALAAALHGIPLRRLTRAQIADRRTKGFVSHADTEAVFGSPGRRSDPGGGFPWSAFLARIEAGGDAMPSLDEIRKVVADEVARVWTYKGTGVDRDAYHHLIHGGAPTERAVGELLAAEVARIRHVAGRPPDDASDRVWVRRILAGTHTLQDARQALT